MVYHFGLHRHPSPACRAGTITPSPRLGLYMSVRRSDSPRLRKHGDHIPRESYFPFNVSSDSSCVGARRDVLGHGRLKSKRSGLCGPERIAHSHNA